MFHMQQSICNSDLSHRKLICMESETLYNYVVSEIRWYIIHPHTELAPGRTVCYNHSYKCLEFFVEYFLRVKEQYSDSQEHTYMQRQVSGVCR